MGSNWQTVKFSDVCDIWRGGSPRPIHEWIMPQGIPWVKISDATAAGSRYIERTKEFIRPEGRAKSREVVSGDLILSNSATPGLPMLMAIDACIHDGWLLLRNFKGIDKLFCYYLLLYERPNLVRQGSGSVFTNLKTAILKNHVVRIPPVKEQQAIACILGALDDKIELNRRMNETLGGMAQAIFKSWFVDFDLVRAKAAGQQLPGLASYIADLFPDAFEASELGKIPREWKYRSLYSCAQYINGAAFRSSDFSPDWSGLPIIKIAELKKGITAKTKFTSKELKSKYLLNNGDILFSWSGSPKTSLDVFLWSGGPAWLNQHIFRVIPNRSIERSFIYSLLRYLKPTFIEIARNKQTTGLGHVTMRDMKDLQVVLPPDEILEAFHRIAGPLLDRVYCNMVESHTLTQLRDTLLPKLISGELRVPDAERFLTEVSS